MKDVKGKVTLKIFIPGFIGLLVAYFLIDYTLRALGVYEGIASDVGFLRAADTISQMKMYGGFIIFPLFYIGAWWGAKRARNEFGNLITQEVVKHVKYYVAFLSFFAVLLTIPEMSVATILYSITLTSFTVKKWLPITAVENTTVNPIS